jgi:hypothetical protein
MHKILRAGIGHQRRHLTRRKFVDPQELFAVCMLNLAPPRWTAVPAGQTSKQGDFILKEGRPTRQDVQYPQPNYYVLRILHDSIL